MAIETTTKVQTKWTLIKLIQSLKSELKLNTRDCIVFSALISFLNKEQERAGGIVFPSNKTLAERAAGLSERSLRRSFAALCATGLIERRDSSTKKRFPLRTHSGKIATAFGFDLSPAFQRLKELMALKDRRDKELQAAKNLRTTMLTIRHDLLQRPHQLSQDEVTFVDDLKSKLRRKLANNDLERLFEQLQKIASKDQTVATTPKPSPKTDTKKLAATNGNSDRHHKNNNIRILKKESPKTIHDPRQLWAKCHAIAEYFPIPPKSPHELYDVICKIMGFLNLKSDHCAKTVQKIGVSSLLEILNYITANIQRIKNPSGYFFAMVEDIDMRQPPFHN